MFEIEWISRTSANLIYCKNKDIVIFLLRKISQTGTEFGERHNNDNPKTRVIC